MSKFRKVTSISEIVLFVVFAVAAMIAAHEGNYTKAIYETLWALLANAMAWREIKEEN